MQTYRLRFTWKGRTYVEQITARSTQEARAWLFDLYPGANLIDLTVVK